MIWKRHLTLDELNATSDNTMVAHLGIVYTRLGDDVLEAEMPVDTRTHQPFGLLHGGASAALAETLGSMAGFMMTRDGQCVVGTELNATHHRPVSEGKVRGVCQPLHLGRQNQSWEIVVFDEQGRRCCTCRLGTNGQTDGVLLNALICQLLVSQLGVGCCCWMDNQALYICYVC